VYSEAISDELNSFRIRRLKIIFHHNVNEQDLHKSDGKETPGTGLEAIAEAKMGGTWRGELTAMGVSWSVAQI
jgi:hypothetical protein